MSVDTKLNFDQETITQFSKQSGEPDWMLNLRLQGINQYQELPLPKLEKTKIDKWNIDTFIPFQAQPVVSSAAELSENVQELIAAKDGEVKAILVQKDASVIYTNVPEELTKQGVVFTSLQSALATHGDLIKQHFMQKESKVDSHKLAALHTAAWSGGAFLFVPKNVEVNIPLQVVFEASAEQTGLFPHVVIIAEANSKVCFIDSYVSAEGTAGIQNGIVEVQVESGAKVTFTSVRTLSEQITDYIYRHATVENDGRLEWVLGELSSGNTITQNTTHLLGNGSSVDSKLITVGSSIQKENVVSRVVHTGENSDSQVLMKGVVKDESTAILNGITFIEKGATKANGEQVENILMLSPQARGDANPILLIDEDDVKAGHAASAGQLNQMQLFYLMSRGISKTEAQRLIINGFVAPVVDAVELEGVAKLLERAIERKVYQ
ncbi:MAG TPA: Fe-S cluster assembly protein SufD [Bacillota bacterium]|nr:Fe-S cluster assembly protein SufD [Bacillota bacterium]